MKKLLYLFFSLSILHACNEPEDAFPKRQENLTPYEGSKEGVFVLNEGNFGWGYGTIDYIDLQQEEVLSSIYEQANQELLGNVVQSASYFQGYYYVVVNNSQKVVIIEPQTFKKVGEVNDLISPRYFLGIDEEKAYVSDLYADAIHILNPSTFKKVGEIPTEGWTEQMLLIGKYAVVAAYDSHELLIINTETDKIEKSIALQAPPNSLQLDKNNYLWVLTGAGDDQQAHLYQLNPEDFSISKDILLDASAGGPGHLQLNNTKDSLYYLQQGVFKLSIMADSAPAAPLIEETISTLFYGLGISPEGDIWLADALDYVQGGWARRYSGTGVPIDSFRVGVIPNSFLFH
ncbi:YncE family protein [Nafulsella turpanensis]|uniref:YncE family protein n=1 Tax=Nafulsella turpanensis TaxID=1265690 RepID=UPI00034CFE96|nr:DUF5074 domain-containing protein [Nafulsella turpanensis]